MSGMVKRIRPENRQELVRIELGKGAYLLLTWPEYAMAIERGKRERRKQLLLERKSRRDEQAAR